MVTGTTYEVTEDEANEIIKNLSSNMISFPRDEEYITLFVKHIVSIYPLIRLDSEGVVFPKNPSVIKEQKAREEESKVIDLDSVLKR